MYTLGEGGGKLNICGLDHSGSETFIYTAAAQEDGAPFSLTLAFLKLSSPQLILPPPLIPLSALVLYSVPHIILPFYFRDVLL